MTIFHLHIVGFYNTEMSSYSIYLDMDRNKIQCIPRKKVLHKANNTKKRTNKICLLVALCLPDRA